MAKLPLLDLKSMLDIFTKESLPDASQGKDKGKAIEGKESLPDASQGKDKGKAIEGSSSSAILGKRNRTQCEGYNEPMTVGEGIPSWNEDYYAGVRDSYMKMSEELLELRMKFRSEGWFMALKAAKLNAHKIGLGRGPPFDPSPISFEEDSASDYSSSSTEDSAPISFKLL